MQKHFQNKKLKHQSQMLLDKLNGISGTALPDVLSNLTEAPSPATDDTSSSYNNALASKINRQSHVNCLSESVGG